MPHSQAVTGETAFAVSARKRLGGLAPLPPRALDSPAFSSYQDLHGTEPGELVRVESQSMPLIVNGGQRKPEKGMRACAGDASQRSRGRPSAASTLAALVFLSTLARSHTQQ